MLNIFGYVYFCLNIKLKYRTNNNENVIKKKYILGRVNKDLFIICRDRIIFKTG